MADSAAAEPYTLGKRPREASNGADDGEEVGPPMPGADVDDSSDDEIGPMPGASSSETNGKKRKKKRAGESCWTAQSRLLCPPAQPVFYRSEKDRSTVDWMPGCSVEPR